jgi:hypothetical protein
MCLEGATRLGPANPTYDVWYHYIGEIEGGRRIVSKQFANSLQQVG